jgi:UDP-N-acetylmuramoyl-L-alanyl-D-glutamate--2,6-diaminopimelate ligase
MERVPDPDAERGLLALVDYAHSPDSVALALDAVRTAASGRVVVVLGAGGDRDPHKRPHMGEAAARRADVVVVTDDNPRTEDPAAIRRAVLEGVDSVPGVERYEIGDRAEAIGTAVALAGGRGVVLVLGKGHELGQEVAGVVTPFDDRRVLAAAMAATAPRATR